MSDWEEYNEDYNFEEKIRGILEGLLIKTQKVNGNNIPHHMGHGRQYLDAYNIAIRFAERYPDDFEGIGRNIHGRDDEQRQTLQHFIAQGLSRGIQNGTIENIEGGFLYIENTNISFTYGDETIRATSNDISIYRFVE